MRLFLDANVMTYIAVFELYVTEGPDELPAALEFWQDLQRAPPDPNLLREVHALRVLYLIDDQAHFDFLFSDLALGEIANIQCAAKRAAHDGLLQRLIEHRRDVYEEEGRASVAEEREARFAPWQPGLPERMWSDARQYAEADIVDAYYFVTNDAKFIGRAQGLGASTLAIQTSELPFVRPCLEAAIAAAT